MRWFRDQATAATYNSGELSTRATQATHPMALVPSKVIVRSVDAIPPLKCPYFKFKRAVFNGFRLGPLLSGPALTDHERRALLRATDPETRRLWLLSLTHTTNTTSPPNNGRRSGPERVRSSRRRVHVGRRPCVVVGGLPVPRSRTPTTRCRAGAYATGITPGVCVRALDVHGRGCAGDGLLQRRDDRRKRTHERKAGPAE